MSVLLAIETATDQGSVALGDGGAVAGEVALGVRSRHAESLLPAVDFLLAAARLGRGDIRGIVVGAGPGSFTGVRVAAATARGLARGLDVPLFAFSSLAALAVDTASAGLVCSLLDARRGEVYAACYEVEAGGDRLREVLAPAALTVAELCRQLGGRRPVFSGDGAIRHAAELGIEPPVLRLPRAAALLRLAAADPVGGRIAEAAGWEPTYLRTSGAERGVAG
jgi:tRNA threonylcarbamoyladenosine biosynthesis protein TsaB